jgi:NADH dehydrogenase (ubiquinone) Fe-S protein 6
MSIRAWQAATPKLLKPPASLAIAVLMLPPPELIRVSQPRVACDGATDIPGGAALGHPRVFLQIDEHGYVDCGYCDRRFVLIGGAADGVDPSELPDYPAGASV